MKNSIILFLAVLTSVAGAVDLGLVSVNDTISFPLLCLDTLGRKSVPDSAHVIVWYHGQGADDFSYALRSAAPESTAWIDTVSYGGAEYLYFIDMVGDIDSNYTSGLFTGMVSLWDQGYPTINPFSFSKTGQEADFYFGSNGVIADTVNKGTRVSGIDNGTINSSTFSSGAIDASSLDSTALDKITHDLYAMNMGDSAGSFGGINPFYDLAARGLDSAETSKPLIRSVSNNTGGLNGQSFDDIWRNRDTVHVDSSIIGIWLANNNNGSLTIPDSIAARIDSILASLGIYSDTTIQAKLGAYPGGPGDNKNIKDDIANLAVAGNGTEPETLYVFSQDSTAIEGAAVTIRNIGQTSTKSAGLRTDINGRLIMDLNPESLVVALHANDYLQLDLDTIVVAAGGGSETLLMTRFDPGNPPSPDLCRVYGWVYDITGDSLENIDVTAQIPAEYQPVKYYDVLITPYMKTTRTDSSGYWQIDLFPNSLLSVPDSRYLFSIEYPSGVILKSKAAVPDSISWRFK